MCPPFLEALQYPSELGQCFFQHRFFSYSGREVFGGHRSLLQFGKQVLNSFATGAVNGSPLGNHIRDGDGVELSAKVHTCRDQGDDDKGCSSGDRVIRCASGRSEEHTSELQSLMRISYAVFCFTKYHNFKLNLTIK